MPVADHVGEDDRGAAEDAAAIVVLRIADLRTSDVLGAQAGVVLHVLQRLVLWQGERGAVEQGGDGDWRRRARGTRGGQLVGRAEPDRGAIYRLPAAAGGILARLDGRHPRRLDTAGGERRHLGRGGRTHVGERVVLRGDGDGRHDRQCIAIGFLLELARVRERPDRVVAVVEVRERQLVGLAGP